MNDSSSEPASYFQDFMENYWDLIAGTIFAIIAFILHKTGHIYLSTLFAGLGIAAFSFTVSEIAEILAERLQEPYASFVLTFSAVAVEILLLFMILLESSHGSSALETVKGGIISAVIVDMNVLLGIAVFIGGLRFKEQEHNEDTSSTYTTILLVASVALLVPSLLQYSKGSGESIMTASYIISFLLMIYYITIFIFQTKTHIHFFKATARSRIFRLRRKKADQDEEDEEEENYIFEKLPNIANFFTIFGLIFIIGVIAEIFASDGMQIAKNYGISPALAGLVIAIISVSPELFTAIKAAKSDQIQRVVNIAMGASTVSILLTVPILMMLSPLAGIELALDFNSLQIGALILTVILAWKTTDNGETNYVEGISHLMFFLAYAVIAAFYH
ncbi:sodium:proton exchanger [Hydrogenimonas thermophila]|uniref:calcium:proton antiporter n=1 Tax=Hydrogenimonas thermophila TaxID=223786 RepID=UPI002936F9BB|nr:sodium:proton exchanger [Hydrogenimonas thermophila]WOE69266.1 sodium:proton exchanger [Hydrogenimonas thermophila]WOE71776.1 sodium:proton exchanger [Hydrogenimonas thermophila]